MSRDASMTPVSLVPVLQRVILLPLSFALARKALQRINGSGAPANR